MYTAGTFAAVATHSQFGTSSKGNEQVVLSFKLLEGPDKGQNITWFGYFTKDTGKRTMESLRYCGWKGTSLAELGNLDQKVNIVIKHETYEGKTVAKVAWVNKIGSGHIELKAPMDSNALRMFAAKMESKAKQYPEVDGESVDSGAIAANEELPPPPGDNDLQEDDWAV